eukprot:16221530-Heterocapsa_arctica.AAC.1
MSLVSVLIDINLRRDEIYEPYKYELLRQPRESDGARAGGLLSLALATRASCERELGNYEVTELTGIYDDNFDFQSIDDMLNY